MKHRIGSSHRVSLRHPRRGRSRPLPQAERLETRLTLATFSVTNAADSGAGSLRQAIIGANAMVGPDDINFDPVFFNTARTITLTAASGQLSVTDSVNIAGPGTSTLTVSGSNAVRVFSIAGTNILNVTISGMRITGGNGTTNGVTAADGGGILTTDEAVTLNNVIVSGNSTTGANDGGGIAVSGTGALTVRNSTVSGNTSAADGGGIYFFSGGSLLLENSTVSGNTAPGPSGGGGIYFFGATASGGVIIRNSTIANNAATSSGGGIVFRSLASNVNPVVIQNSTITGNSAGTTSSTDGLGGGGIAVSSGTANSIISLVSTIVSGNTATAANGRSDIAAIALATVNVNFCAVGDADGFTPSGTSANNLPFGSALNLLTLASYGGPTQTVALGLGSLAVNAGSNPAGLTTDQRGTGFPRVVGAAADIGAFEGTLDVPTANGTFANVTTAGATTYTFQVTYGGGTNINVSTLDSNDIRVTGPNTYNQLATFISANPPVNGTPVVATYRINAPGGSFDASDFGTYTVAVEPNQVANTNSGFVPAGSLGTFQVLIPTTFTVSNVSDSGAGSLRQAILNSNATPGATDTIVFQGLPSPPTINLAAASGQLNITDSVTIIGPGAGNLTVSGQNAIRVFNVENATSVITVSISGMMIAGGNGIPVSGGTASDGGGVRVTDENLTLDGVVITGNSVGGTNDGGGIGITSVTNLVIRNSTVSGNTAADSGGGIYFFSGGSLLLENSTVSGNTAPGLNGGGGIYFFGAVAAGGFTIRNSTVANNSATNATTGASGGGGIVLRSFTGTTLIQDSTISGNTSASTSVTDGLGGGGIALATGSATSILTLQNTIVAGNTSANLRPDFSAIAASTVNANFCLIGAADTFTLSGTSGNNLSGTVAAPLNPMLGALANNGGPTQTMLPDAASPVINAGSNALIPVGVTTDQRGPGFPRIQGGTVDMGAVERTIAVPPTVANAVFNFLTSQSLVFTFDQAVNFPSGLPAAFVVHNNTTNTNIPFNAVQNDPTMVTLTPTGAPAIFPDGDYTATVVASNIRNANGMNMAANFPFNFFFLNADANRDRRVNLPDFNILAANFGQSPRNFSQADFNYDTIVNLIDFNILAARFGQILAAPGAGLPGQNQPWRRDGWLDEILA
jgi:parallel beta-helix repeat protein